MDIKELCGKTVFITGATGLIGKNIIYKLCDFNKSANEKVKIIALIRNEEKAKKIFSNEIYNQIKFVVSDICNLKPENMNSDYIIHGANQTSSKAFVNEPVETVLTAINGTKAVLDFAKVNPVKSFVFLSTMEVYGCPENDDKIYENHSSNINALNVRSCYPESKRMCENLCICYSSEYNIPAKIVRLTQTFGPGVEYNDGRVFAEFARCAIEGRNIVLKTKGETKRSYLYTEDAVSAILTVLLNGENEKAYNAANEDSYCSIYDMAKLVASLSDKNISVEIKEAGDTQKLGYAPTLKMNLSTDALKSL